MKEKEKKKKKKEKKEREEKGEELEKSTEVVPREWDYLPITMEPWFQEGEAIADEVFHRKVK